MKAVFTRCWTCPLALLGKGMTVPARGPTTPCARVPLPGQCAEMYSGKRLRIWRASSSCWNAGDFEVTDRNEALRDLSAYRTRQYFPVSYTRRSGARVGLGQRLPRWSAHPTTLRLFASYLRLRPP